ncbi:hypothetical protein FHG87_021170 [Trinorchestia longiramus]|nr:hypothetical protein FHG87_021170 [Trinorchestia longiramus]
MHKCAVLHDCVLLIHQRENCGKNTHTPLRLCAWMARLNVRQSNEVFDQCQGQALSVNRRTWRWNEGNTSLCLQCNRGVEETVEHLILVCSKCD